MLPGRPEQYSPQSEQLAALLGEAGLAFHLGNKVAEVVDGLPIPMTIARLRHHAEQVATFFVHDKNGIRMVPPSSRILRLVLAFPYALPQCPVDPPLQWLKEPSPEVRFLRCICSPMRSGLAGGSPNAPVYAIRSFKGFGGDVFLYYRRLDCDAHYDNGTTKPSEAVWIDRLREKPRTPDGKVTP